MKERTLVTEQITDNRMDRREFMSALGVAAATAIPLEVASSAPAEAAAETARAATGSADVSGLPWPERGCFGGKIIVGPHRANATAMLSKQSLMGLPREMSFFYGALRDQNGNLIEIVRMLPDRATHNPTLFVQDNTGKDTLHAVAAGLLDIKGTLLGPGLQWYAADREGCELYVSQICLMEGTYRGRTVRGILAFDQSYEPEGQSMYSGNDPLFRQYLHHRCWYTWGTVLVEIALALDTKGSELLARAERASPLRPHRAK
ncbi:MAG: hypothetical protein ACJ8R9_11215 [Steroidobacteraceae bacterium]